MGANDKEDLIILLLLETRFHNNEEYYEKFKDYDCNKLNKRFNELLDKFLNKYALNNTEKSGRDL